MAWTGIYIYLQTCRYNYIFVCTCTCMVCTGFTFLYRYKHVCTWYRHVCTVLPNPVQVVRIPDGSGCRRPLTQPGSDRASGLVPSETQSPADSDSLSVTRILQVQVGRRNLNLKLEELMLQFGETRSDSEGGLSRKNSEKPGESRKDSERLGKT